MMDLEAFAITGTVIAVSMSLSAVLLEFRASRRSAGANTVTVTIRDHAGRTRYVGKGTSGAPIEVLEREIERALRDVP